MTKYSWLDGYLLAKPGAEKDYKPEWDWLRYRVREKMYAAVCTPGAEHGVYGGHPQVLLKCEPAVSEFLRAQYPDSILPGFYSDKRTWISVFLDGGVPDDELRALCDASYKLVFGKLTKKLQKEIAGE